ncbi:tripartite tricarboxylate transporter TctB family protein [Martelella mediterranea]|uniref:Tripartite tricarboxylate transporter TctB family protein n=1 Tax=Martelella mediterranea DSM 17316 TaxID=1122214 RepID=A0A1U9YWN6_9HYPH|nr:tripartite tricarboxylate transporter TctB family protein [Martelella mediterranea]AQZ49772.1 Tripartite tricarboxylate transporter TctB family protein [Martelella mediterranea DSM 17316]
MSSSREKALLFLPVAFFFAIAGIVFWQTSTVFVEMDAAGGPPQYNAALVPDGLAWLLVIFGVVQAVRILIGQERFSDGSVPAPDGSPGPEESFLLLRAAMSFAALVAFTAMLPVIGFYLAMPALMFVLMLILGNRSPVTLVAASLLTTLAAGYVFGALLNVRLPVGMFELTIW